MSDLSSPKGWAGGGGGWTDGWGASMDRFFLLVGMGPEQGMSYSACTPPPQESKEYLPFLLPDTHTAKTMCL